MIISIIIIIIINCIIVICFISSFRPNLDSFRTGSGQTLHHDDPFEK